MKRNFTAFIDDLKDDEKSKVPRCRPEEQDRWFRDGDGDAGDADGGTCLVTKCAGEERRESSDGLRSSGDGNGGRVKGAMPGDREEEEEEEEEEKKKENGERETGEADLLDRISLNIARVNAGLEGALGGEGMDRRVLMSAERAWARAGVGAQSAGGKTLSIVGQYMNELEELGTHCPGPGLDDEDDEDDEDNVRVSEARCCGAPGLVWTEEMQREMEAASMMPLPDDVEDGDGRAKGEESGKWVFARADHGI